MIASNAYRASRLVLELTRDPPRPAPVWQTSLGPFTAAVHEPIGSVCGVVVLVDGGASDPVRQAHALANAGYRVVVPMLFDASAHEIAGVIELVATHGGLGGRRPVGVIGSAIAGSLALRAAARIPTLVSVVCAIGTCPVVDARAIDVPVVLLHGRDDRLASESRSLHRGIRAAGGRSTLAITPLLSNGELRLGPALLMGALPVLRAFAHFFELVEEGARAKALPRPAPYRAASDAA